MKLLIHYQTSTVKLLKFGNGEVISSHIWMDMFDSNLTNFIPRAQFIEKYH